MYGFGSIKITKCGPILLFSFAKSAESFLLLNHIIRVYIVAKYGSTCYLYMGCLVYVYCLLNGEDDHVIMSFCLSECSFEGAGVYLSFINVFILFDDDMS